MNEFIIKFKEKSSHFFRFVFQDSKVVKIFYISLALSALSLISLVFMLKRNNKFVFKYAQNIGFLRFVKRDINKYEHLNKKQILQKVETKSHSLYRIVFNRFYSYPSGITNYGNNCYINVLLQCFASNPDFIIYLKQIIQNLNVNINKADENDFKIIRELEKSLEEINYETSTVSIYSLVNSINNKYSFEHEQQDSYELFHRLFELFENNFDNKISENPKNPFLIEWEIQYKCSECSNIQIKKEHSMDISLMPTDPQYSVNFLLKNYFEKSTINDYICSKCSAKNIINQITEKLNNTKEDNKIEKLLKIQNYLKELTSKNITEGVEMVVKNIVDFCDDNNCDKLLQKFNFFPIKKKLIKIPHIMENPKILIIHIKQVFFEEDMITKKQKIYFEENLEIVSHRNSKINKYILNSFIEHIGSHSSGHYISYRKYFDKWVIINDNSVKLIDKNTAFKVSNPYMLFYKLVDN